MYSWTYRIRYEVFLLVLGSGCNSGFSECQHAGRCLFFDDFVLLKVPIIVEFRGGREKISLRP